MRVYNFNSKWGCLGILVFLGIIIFLMATVFHFLLASPIGLILIGFFVIMYFVRAPKRSSSSDDMETDTFMNHMRGTAPIKEASYGEDKEGFDRGNAIDVTDFHEVDDDSNDH